MRTAIHISSGIAVGLLALAVMWRPARGGEGQIPEDIVPRTESIIETTVYVARNEEILKALKEAESAAAKADWPAAIDAWQGIIENRVAPQDRSGAMIRTGRGPLFISAVESARRALSAMPSAGLKHYRAIYDTKAEQLFKKARRSHNTASLKAVADLYPACSLADDALDALAELYLESGRPLAALWSWQRLLDICPDSDCSLGAIHLKMALCAQKLGQRDAAQRFLTVARREQPQPLLMGREPAQLPELKPVSSTSSTWPILGGSPAQSAIAPQFVDRGHTAWNFTWPQPDICDRMISGAQHLGRPIPLICRPVDDGRRTIISGTVAAAAFDRDGRRLWAFPENPPLPGLERLEDRICSGHLLDGIYYTVLRGRPHAIRARDGELVWKASEDVAPPDDADASSDGALLGPDSILSPPVVTGNHVWCAVTRFRQEAESCLAMFDRTTGKLLRWVFLCSHNSPDHLGIGSTPAPPAAYGGLIFACSNTGVIAAVDQNDGSIRWLHRYNFLLPQLKHFSIRQSKRWANNPVIAAGGRVFAAPQDSDFIFAFDARTGELLWRQPRNRRRYLAGIVDDLVIVSGRNAAAINAVTGKLLWESDTLEGDPAGCPALAADGLLVPTTEALYRIDPKSGKGSAVWRWDGRSRPGNLVIAGGRLLIAWEQGLLVIEPWQQTQKRLSAKLKNPATAAEAHYELGAIARRRGDVEPARRHLATALELAQDDALRSKIHSELTAFHLGQAYNSAEALRWQDAAKHSKLALEYTESDTNRIEALVGLAQAHEHLGNWPQAVDTWQRLLSEHRASMHSFTSGLSTRCGWFARARIDSIIDAHGRETYARHEAAAAELLEKGSPGVRSPWLKTIGRYPNSTAAGLARLRLADAYEEEPHKAVYHLEQFIREHPRSPELAGVLFRIAGICRKAGRLDEAAAALHRVIDEFPFATLPDHFATASEIAERELKRPEFRALQGAADSVLTLPIIKKWRTPAQLTLNSPIITPGAQGTLLISQNAFSKVFFGGLHRARLPYDNLVCRDLETGELLWARSPGNWSGRVIVTKNSLLLPSFQQMLALDPASGRTLWLYTHGTARRLLLPHARRKAKPIPGAEGFDTIITVEADRINGWAPDGDRIYITGTGGRLTCIDTASGRKIWEQNVPASTHRDSVMVSKGIVAVCTTMPGRILGYDAKTGNARSFVDFEVERNRMTDLPAKFASQGRMAVVLNDSRIHMVDIVKGAELWSHKCTFSVNSLIAAPDGSMVVVVPNTLAAQGKLTALDATTGKPVWAETFKPNELEAIGIGGDIVVALLYREKANLAVCYDLKSGEKTWESVPLGRVQGGGVHVASGCVAVWGDRLEASAVLLSARDGSVLQRVAPPPVDHIAARLIGDTFCVASNRGCFGYGQIDTERVTGRVEYLLEQVRQHRADAQFEQAHVAALKAAGLLIQLHRHDKAKAIAAEALADPRVDPVMAERLFDRLSAAREALVEQSPPKLVAYKFDRPPTIDGAIDDDWHAFESARLDGAEAIELILPGPGRNAELLPWMERSKDAWPPRWAGPNDLSARLYVGWSEKYLYIAVDVDDSIHRSYKADLNYWAGDGLIISIDCANDGGFEYRRDDLLFTQALVDKPMDDRRNRREPEGEYRVKIKPNQSGVVYEAAMPWDYINYIKNPRDGTSFGLNITVIDDDGNETSKSVSWSPALFLHHDSYRLLKGFSPEFFGDIILKDRKSAPKPKEGVDEEEKK